MTKGYFCAIFRRLLGVVYLLKLACTLLETGFGGPMRSLIWIVLVFAFFTSACAVHFHSDGRSSRYSSRYEGRRHYDRGHRRPVVVERRVIHVVRDRPPTQARPVNPGKPNRPPPQARPQARQPPKLQRPPKFHVGPRVVKPIRRH